MLSLVVIGSESVCPIPKSETKLDLFVMVASGLAGNLGQIMESSSSKFAACLYTQQQRITGTALERSSSIGDNSQQCTVGFGQIANSIISVISKFASEVYHLCVVKANFTQMDSVKT